MQFLVDVALYSEEAEELLNDALTGIAHTVTRVGVIGEVVADCNGYPWQKLAVADERNVARLPVGAPVYGEYM